MKKDSAAPTGSGIGISRFVAATSDVTSGSGSGNWPIVGMSSMNERSLVPVVSRWRKSCATIVNVGIPPPGNAALTPVISPTNTRSSGSGA